MVLTLSLMGFWVRLLEMNSDFYMLEGPDAPVGHVNAFRLAELSFSGHLAEMRVRLVETGAYLSDDQVQAVIQSVQLPPPIQFARPVQGLVDGNKDPLRFVAPIHVSGWAVAAGYLGLFSLVLIFAPFSLWAGLMALKDLKAHPHKTGRGRAIFGIVMGAVFSLLLIGALGTALSNP